MLLENIKSPEDIKDLPIPELKDLAEELRDTIIETVATNGGHLASNLGTVDITIALHYVFNSPTDKIIWDVGHQAYAHKLLTGRFNAFPTIRKYGGISGFPKRAESPHDAFGTGHSSTSISAALGILEGRDQNKEKFNVIPVIGDGALTAGLAFEGLNNTGHLKKNLIVILNDNEMSISPNVGALSAYLRRMMMGDLYTKLKKETKLFLERIPAVGEPVLKIAQKAEGTVKGLVVPGLLFEELGFQYVGPVDGHKIDSLIETLETFKDFPGPVLIHAITKKGKGYKPAEKHPGLFHGIGPFNIETGEQFSSSKKSYSEIFGSCLTKLAQDDDRIIAITAAMTEGTGLSEFVRTFPKRFYDVGIAEPHAVTFAAGLATQGLKPVVAIYSTFLQRAYDEIVHDVCLQNLPVVFAIDRAGIVGDDGPTHNGTFDLSYLRHIPNLVVMAPKDGYEFRCMIGKALSLDAPVAIRYPRGTVTDGRENDELQDIPVGKSEVICEGQDILIIAAGNTVTPSVDASGLLKETDINACVINARFIKPIDMDMISARAREIKYVLTVEENAVSGGFGSAVLEKLADAGVEGVKLKILGLPDRFIEQGPQTLLRQKLGIDAEGIAREALTLVRSIHHA
ncbi:MAG TPA: 1-deoxy-D-xylulose-5-phosphate synthase [Nitrospirae bacterium]|nr:1-deoxy-D-xylulose-5-phosphate synthase [bacterium BMS3Abin06]HDH11876.1 1-deoxy-D-xylulose-5-phosphate synthase [Nitrospirota bacterium]HDZ02782.1 1-deoxy-D-xylulose-5-phosphate synthase [Nitrospirota bacterium]